MLQIMWWVELSSNNSAHEDVCVPISLCRGLSFSVFWLIQHIEILGKNPFV